MNFAISPCLLGTLAQEARLFPEIVLDAAVRFGILRVLGAVEAFFFSFRFFSGLTSGFRKGCIGEGSWWGVGHHMCQMRVHSCGLWVGAWVFIGEIER
jgi:hypothetical protein